MLAALVYFFIRGVCKIIFHLLHEAYLTAQLVRIPNIVTVKERNIVAVCHIHSSVARRRGTEIDIGFKQVYSVVVCCHTAHRINCTVRGIVIGNDKLPVTIRLILYGFYAL